MPLRPWLQLAALSVVLGAAPTSRAAQVDLTTYLAPVPLVGDYRVYVERANGVEREWRVDVASVEELPGGWRAVWESGAATTEESVRTGIKSRGDGYASPPLSFQLAVDWKLRGWDLSLRVGATRRFHAGFLDSPSFPFFEWVRHRGRYRLAGFEAIETPYVSHTSAARVDSLVEESRAQARLRKGFEVDHGPGHLAWVRTSESWFVDGVGLVGVRSSVQEAEQRGLGPPALTEVWLKEARIQGVPYP